MRHLYWDLGETGAGAIFEVDWRARGFGLRPAAAIRADLLGLHVNIAVRWITYARSDWTGYLADRAAEQRASHTR
ncbi:hypothetical protein [Nonomuraea dietziae]|uniref:hypothetical protein n=1 Tax=Nonomuraea dietziae TaxID=65515 RepID=UPI00342B9F77